MCVIGKFRKEVIVILRAFIFIKEGIYRYIFFGEN